MRLDIEGRIYNPDFHHQDRKIMTPSSALGLLREELVRNIGIERMKGFLIRFGWEMGVADGKKALESNLPFTDIVKQGPMYHTTNGHIRGNEYNGYAEMGENGQVLSIYGDGIWADSYEAIEHVNRLGLSQTQVCHTLTGYASGFMSTICKHEVLAKEVTCIGRGDKECRWILKSLHDWNGEMDEERQYYHQTPILEELEYTYEQLLEQKNFITRLSNLQRKLTEEVSKESSLQTITDHVFTELQKPIMIEDTDGQMLAYSGLGPAPDPEKIKRLKVPIVLQNRVIGYCSFIYDEEQPVNLQNDRTLLDRIANAASLIFLNEKIRYESLVRMKGDFLEQLLSGYFSNRQEIIKRGKYANLNLKLPFHLAVVQTKITRLMSMEDEFHLREQIFEAVNQYFEKSRNQVLVGRREGNIIVFLAREPREKGSIQEVMHTFYEDLAQNYRGCSFKIGISNEGEEIENLGSYYREALVALRLATTRKIVSFQSLGIVGVLISSNNVDGIRRVAKQELGALLDHQDPKKMELIKSLYVFLRNGGKLEQTMQDLSISMSGLKYRIQRLESLLGKELRNPAEAYPLLLILESLIAIGELELK